MSERLTTADVAAHLGVRVETVRSYAARRASTGFPEPDEMIGRTPTWRTATIDAWAASRPGQGVGGGRKPAAR